MSDRVPSDAKARTDLPSLTRRDVKDDRKAVDRNIRDGLGPKRPREGNYGAGCSVLDVDTGHGCLRFVLVSLKIGCH